MDPVNTNLNENQMPVSPTPVEPTPVASSSAPEIDPSLVEPETTSAVPPSVMVGATDPITMPNPPKAPDPVEEELKTPMTAAAPVPGSIGSAISVPAEQQPASVDLEAITKQPSTTEVNNPQPNLQPAGGVPQMPNPMPVNNAPQMPNPAPVNNTPQIPNVAFNDPANAQPQPLQNPMMGQAPAANAKKKMNKNTLIMLCATAGLVVVALVIVLIMMLN